MPSYLENGAFNTHSYYRTLIGNHMQAIDWCHFRRPWVTPGHYSFKRRVSPKRRILQTQLLYRTLIVNRRQAIDRQASYTAYNPTALTQTVQTFRKRHVGLSATAGLSCYITLHYMPKSQMQQLSSGDFWFTSCNHYPARYRRSSTYRLNTSTFTAKILHYRSMQ